MKKAGKLSPHDAGNPVHDKDPAIGELLGLVQHCNCFLYVADAVKPGHCRSVLGAQQDDGAQV